MALSGETNVLSPAPAEIALGDCAASNRAKNRSTDDCHGVTDYSCTALLCRPDVAQDTTSIGDRRGTKEASEKPG